MLTFYSQVMNVGQVSCVVNLFQLVKFLFQVNAICTYIFMHMYAITSCWAVAARSVSYMWLFHKIFMIIYYDYRIENRDGSYIV